MLEALEAKGEAFCPNVRDEVPAISSIVVNMENLIAIEKRTTPACILFYYQSLNETKLIFESETKMREVSS